MFIYSQVLVDDGSHVTLEFAPGSCSLLEGMELGADVIVTKIGYYEDADISADIVVVSDGINRWEFQADGVTPLHITRECRNGVSPVQSGIRARENGYVFSFACSSHSWSEYGVLGFFEGKSRLPNA